MNKKIDLIKLARGMSTKDKARLLFADCLKKFETLGKERLLAAHELDMLREDARKNHQIDELNSYISGFNATSMFLNEVKIEYLNFALQKTRLEIVMAGHLLRNSYEDGIDHLIYSFARSGYTDEQLEDKNTQKEFDEKAKALRKEYGLEEDKLSIVFDLFEPPITPESYFTAHFKTIEYQPNPLIRDGFTILISKAKKLKLAIYKIRYLELLKGLDFLTEKDLLEIESFESVITETEQLGGLLYPLKIFQFDDFINDLKIPNRSENKFLEIIKSIKTALELSEEEKSEVEDSVESLLKLI